MPHAALWVVQQPYDYRTDYAFCVSMPHAALWVVQLPPSAPLTLPFPSFNAARGFVGGAASSLSALFPLGGKSTFGKSPEIREF